MELVNVASSCFGNFILLIIYINKIQISNVTECVIVFDDFFDPV